MAKEKKETADVEKEIDEQIESMKKEHQSPGKPIGTDKASIEKLAEELKKKGTLRDNK